MEIKLKVEDFDKWKTNFENNVGLRKEYGSRGAVAYSDPEARNDVTIVIKAMNKADVARSRESGEFQQAMKDSGVVGEPQMRFLTFVNELET
ncbi:MAG: hypothetical protein IH840_01640 [Candidatus Heimdallarchaeota archaeon]|nr:hypothetical protein [Candidatus Heimdallarchaeota archaeon]